MKLDREQRIVLTTALDQAKRMNATPRETKALVEALITESSIRNLPGGLDDSAGPLQQRPSQGWKHPRNVRLAVADFLSYARTNSKMAGDAGRLAQSVQRSAYPERYAQHAGEAESLINMFQKPGTPNSQFSTAGKAQSRVGRVNETQFQSVVEERPGASSRVALAQYLSRVDPKNLLLRTGAISVDEPTTRTRLVPTTTSRQLNFAPSSSSGAGTSKSAKGMSPLLELIHNGGQGNAYAVKNGQKVNPSFYSGVWAGHANHVHVAAGPKTIVQLGKLAQSMGLTVSENPHFGTVHQVHAPNSYHYKGEAIDVSGDPQLMNKYARQVESIYGLK